MSWRAGSGRRAGRSMGRLRSGAEPEASTKAKGVLSTQLWFAASMAALGGLVVFRRRVRLRQGLRVRHPAIAQGLDQIEDLRPGRKRSRVGSLVLIDSHHELELLIRHLSFFGRLAVFAASPPGASSPIQSKTTVHHVLASLHELGGVHVGLVPPRVFGAVTTALPAAGSVRVSFICLCHRGSAFVLVRRLARSCPWGRAIEGCIRARGSGRINSRRRACRRRNRPRPLPPERSRRSRRRRPATR